MTNYIQVLNQVQSLSYSDQLKLLQELSHWLNQTADVQDDEVISQDEILQSQEAWDDYLAGNDQGVTSQELKRRLSGNNLA